MKKLLFAALVLVIGCSKDDPAPLAVANFTFSDDAKFAPLKIQFQAQTENAIKVEWDFGDGNTSTDPNPSHIYTKGGTYQVRLDVFNSEDKKDTKTKSLVVLNAPTKFRIDQIKITNVTIGGWDASSNPDIFLKISDDNNTNYFSTATVDEVSVSTLPLTFSSAHGFPITISSDDFNFNFTIELWDEDAATFEFMGGYYLKVNDHIPDDGSDYPTTIKFGPSSNQIEFTASITWLE